MAKDFKNWSAISISDNVFFKVQMYIISLGYQEKMSF